MWGAPPLWLTLVLGHGRGLTQATRTETYPPVPIRLLSVPPPPGAPLYIARCTASRTTSGSEGSGCHQAQRTGGGEPQRGVLPSRCLSGALTFLTHIPESICGQKESTFLRLTTRTYHTCTRYWNSGRQNSKCVASRQRHRRRRRDALVRRADGRRVLAHCVIGAAAVYNARRCAVLGDAG